MIGAFAKVRRAEDAWEVFVEARAQLQPDTVLFSAAMGAMAHDRRKVRALHEEMKALGLEDDDVSRWQLLQVLFCHVTVQVLFCHVTVQVLLDRYV